MFFFFNCHVEGNSKQHHITLKSFHFILSTGDENHVSCYTTACTLRVYHADAETIVQVKYYAFVRLIHTSRLFFSGRNVENVSNFSVAEKKKKLSTLVLRNKLKFKQNILYVYLGRLLSLIHI